jgi:hypothetical protein
VRGVEGEGWKERQEQLGGVFAAWQISDVDLGKAELRCQRSGLLIARRL